MKFLTRLCAQFVFWFAFAGFVFAADEAVDMNPQVKSGSQLSSSRFGAQFVGDGFMIRSREGGEPIHLSSMAPVYRAAWTSDGQTLATIEHVAGGSDFVAFHFEADAHQWFRINVVPDGSYKAYRVVNWNVGQGDVTVTYEVWTNKAEASALVSLKVDQSVFGSFFQSIKGQQSSTGVVAVSPGGKIRRIPSGGPLNGHGVLAIDTDGSGSAHNDPTHQSKTSAMKDASGQFHQRPDHLPPGFQDLDADKDHYGVAPKNFAKVNGGPLEVGKQMEVNPANHKKDRLQIGDFGPDDQHGENSHAEIDPLGYKIRETSHGPYPWDGSSSADIPVDVTYYP